MTLVEYVRIVENLALEPGKGASLKCPACLANWWMLVPLKPLHTFRYMDSPKFACPAACGYYGDLSTYNPVPEVNGPSSFDTRKLCRSCDVEFAVNGVVVRRPCCAIETPREIMRDVVERIQTHIDHFTPDAAIRNEVEPLLELLVRTFDGLMRRMLEIAHENSRQNGLSETLELREQFGLGPLPATSSFQNLSAARQRLLPAGWDMKDSAQDWERLTKLFQKRHVITHRLGVVDKEYLNKTRDSQALLGKQVPLSSAEVLEGAKDCQRLVNNFFGLFLS
jgi:hypothetical protein